MHPVYVRAVGLAAPGLCGWQGSLPVLRGEQVYEHEDLPAFAPAILPPNERRRTSDTIRLALQVAQEAMQGSGVDLSEPSSVFASCSGDMDIVHRICLALTQAGKPVSPTHFHNSVHNAPAGYWSIGAGASGASTSLSAFDATFAAGVMEALTQVQVEARCVLLMSYDVRPPAPLFASRPVENPFGTALLFSPEPGAGALARISMRLVEAGPQDVMADAGLELMRMDNAAARSLPLLSVLARGGEGEVSLPYLPGSRLTLACQAC